MEDRLEDATIARKPLDIGKIDGVPFALVELKISMSNPLHEMLRNTATVRIRVPVEADRETVLEILKKSRPGIAETLRRAADLVDATTAEALLFPE